MFKSNTRKGFAIGAALALAFAGLVSAPAQAAGEVVLQPSAGTTYNTLVTETFKLQASLGAGQPVSNIAQLKYKIEKASTVPLTVGAAASTTPATTSHNAASTSFVVSPGSTSSTVPNFITIAVTGASAATASADVTVTAWIDSTPNDVVDAGEFSQVRVVSFKKYADVTANIAVTQPLEGDTAIAGTVSLVDINLSQVQSTLNAKVYFAGAATNSNVAVTDGKFSAGWTALTKSATVSADAVISTNKIGASSATYTVTAKAVLDVTNSPVVGDNLKASGSAAAQARINSTFAVKAKVSSTTSKHVAVSGAKVTVQVTTSQTLTSTISLTVNGTTYTDGTKLPTLELTSDASGEALVTLTPAGFAADATITLITKSENNTAANYVVTQKAAYYTVTNDGSANSKTSLGGSYTLGYTVKDQFGALSPKADRLKVKAGSADSVYVNLVGGKASVTFTAPTTSGDVSVVNEEIQEQDADTLNWGARAGSFTASAVTVLATDVVDAFDTAPSATKSATISRVDADGALTNKVTITGSVNNKGAKVTISGAGLKFSVSGTVVADSVVASTDGSGDFTVDVYSHVAGDATITYTVGAATKTTVLTTAAAAYNEGKTLSITTNDTNGLVAPGSTVRATVTLVDEYNNPVAVDDASTASFGITVTGPGFVSTVPSKTGSEGTAEFSVLLGSADSGDIVISATYDADGATTTVAAISATKTVTVGAAPVAEQKVTVGTFKGYVAIYAKGYTGSKLSAKVAGKWLSVAELSSFQRVVRLTGAGYSIKVDLYIDGKFVKSETVVTK